MEQKRLFKTIESFFAEAPKFKSTGTASDIRAGADYK